MNEDKKWKTKEKARARRVALRQRAIDYMGGCCAICKYDRCNAAMDFHHTVSFDKEFSISEKLTSWEKILPELVKCVLLCTNCHREVHDGLHTGFLEIDEYTGSAGF